jgi:glycosyltransferase involved in cell wall biosynthesis
MRVLFSFPHALGAPGIGWTAHNQVIGLISRGHEVHVVAASIARAVPGAASVTTSLTIARRRVPHRAIGRDRAFRWHDSVAARVVRRVRPDVVHSWPLSTGLAADEGRRQGAAVVREAPNTHTAHAWRIVDEEVRTLGLQRLVTSAHTPNARHLAMEQADWDAATAILAPSDAVAQSFIAEGFAEERIVRHRYGFAPSPRRVEPRSAEPGPLRAVYVGLGEPRKGLHFALRAWLESEASLKGTFTVVGRMQPAYADMLGEQLAHPSVTVIGFSNSVPAVLAASDVLLLPTIEEGSALVTYEAQGVGCVPLVSTAAGAMLEHGVQGLVHEPRDVAALTAQLDLLSRDRALLRRLSKGALAHAPALTWDAAADALVAAYEESVARCHALAG